MKQIKKLSLSNVISRLTRNEMRYVMAGSGSGVSCKNSFTKCGSSDDAGSCGKTVKNKCWCSYPEGWGNEDINCNGN